jgi:predicted RNase H-like nuclease (RuvC/YqgF family)
MITNLNVEDEIKKHYLADDGMWLVEKGKIKEAKLLKEAHARILWLHSQYKHYYNAYNTGYQSSVTRYRDEIAELKKELEEQKKINKRLIKLMDGVKSAVAEMVLIDGETK